jgi:hypothetical protein
VYRQLTLGNIINMVSGTLLSKLLGPESKTAMHVLDEAWVIPVDQSPRPLMAWQVDRPKWTTRR